MAGSKIYVCSGAVLRCSMGTSNGSLVATPKNVSLCSHEHANIGDHISMANIRPFGRCRSLGFPATAAATAAHHGHLTPMPCVPGTPAPWSAVNPDVIVTGRPALLNTAKLKCVFGGTITIVNPGQALEYTGASEIEIVSRDVVIQEMFWTDDDDEAESDLASADLSSAPTLCLQTSLSEGDQLIVDIGGRSFPTKVGKGGVAKVKNVDAWEVDLDAPVMRKGDKKKTPSAPAKKPSEPKKPAPSKPAPKKPAEPAPKKPVNPQEVNTAKVPEPSATTTWGDPVASPRIRRNSPSNLYGKVRRGADGKPRNHQGFDYYAPEGTSVMSVADGIVEFTQTGHASYGNNVAIKHKRGNGYVYSFYAHLSRTCISNAVHRPSIRLVWVARRIPTISWRPSSRRSRSAQPRQATQAKAHLRLKSQSRRPGARPDPQTNPNRKIYPGMHAISPGEMLNETERNHSDTDAI